MKTPLGELLTVFAAIVLGVGWLVVAAAIVKFALDYLFN